MNTLILLGSRDPEGRTARAAGALESGLTGKGNKVEKVFLPEKKIERCRQCDANGWGICRTEGRCIIEDDFAALVERIRKADAAVFATPVYFADLSESLRAFLDRLRRIARHEEGKRGITGKPAFGICVAGGGGGGAPSCALSLQNVLTTCGFSVADMVPVRKQNLEVKLAALKDAGAWLAATSESGM